MLIYKRYRNNTVIETVNITEKKIKHNQQRPYYEKLKDPEFCKEIPEQLNIAIK